MNPHDEDVLLRLSPILTNERGMPGIGVAIWRRGEGTRYWERPVGEFLARPENQSGEWLIDGGWGGPPGPVVVEWIGWEGIWISHGYAV